MGDKRDAVGRGTWRGAQDGAEFIYELGACDPAPQASAYPPTGPGLLISEPVCILPPRHIWSVWGWPTRWASARATSSARSPLPAGFPRGNFRCWCQGCPWMATPQPPAPAWADRRGSDAFIGETVTPWPGWRGSVGWAAPRALGGCRLDARAAGHTPGLWVRSPGSSVQEGG